MRLAAIAVLLTALFSGEAFGQIFRRRPTQASPQRQPTETQPPVTGPTPLPGDSPTTERPDPEKFDPVVVPPSEKPKEAPSEKPKEAPKEAKDARKEPEATPVLRRSKKKVFAPSLRD